MAKENQMDMGLNIDLKSLVSLRALRGFVVGFES
jgi:hypothetical protein